MKKSLASFSQEKLQQKSQESELNEEQILQQYDKIKDLSKSQASALLMQEVLRQKKNGTFNFGQLSAEASKLKDYLPPNDYQNLMKLLQTLK